MSVTNPFQASVNIDLPDGTGGQNAFVTVPAGKRLVIEYVSGFAFLPAGQNASFSVFTSLAGQTSGTEHILITTKALGNDFVTGQVVKLYADPGTTVMLRTDRDLAKGAGKARMSLSGQLIAVP
ncbi:MAG TPA: hypothetical protein VLX28_18045 [Thermoanaerobaculia bacterium]|nr:hypothetical protein [Thermoanaerobaculia bacterium]